MNNNTPDSTTRTTDDGEGDVPPVTYVRMKIGDVPVDSGQVMIIDPVYVKATFDTAHDAEPGLNYAGACQASKVHGCGEFGEPDGCVWGVCTTTTRGDGYFPVYADFDSEGNIFRISVKFYDADHDVDDLME